VGTRNSNFSWFVNIRAMTADEPILGPYRSENDDIGRVFILTQRGCVVRDLGATDWSLSADAGLSATLRRREEKWGKRNWIALVSVNSREPQAGVNLGSLQLRPSDHIRFLGIARVNTLDAARRHDADTIDQWRRASNPAKRQQRNCLAESTKGHTSGRKVNRAEEDFRNRELGEKGERYVLDFEKQKLTEASRDDLAKNVRWVSKEDGDGLGYDIRSFENHGLEKFIEVKTTTGDDTTPFYVTQRELDCSRDKKEQYQLLRVYDFSSNPRYFSLQGVLDDGVTLEARVYRATVKDSKKMHNL
jgi:hypothetical protein